MRITNNTIILSTILFVVIGTIAALIPGAYVYMTTFFASISLLFIPGFLALYIMKQQLRIDSYIVFSVGISIAYTLLGGLLINQVAPILGLPHPLGRPFFLGHSLFLLVLIMIADIRNREFSITIPVHIPSLRTTILAGIPIIFPILSVIGGILLTNKSMNILSLSVIFFIAIYVILLMLYRNVLSEFIYPWVIFFISTSLLLLFSLSSKHILGYDINFEYELFQLTKHAYFWSMSNFPGDPYNACLSITILPTIFSYMLHIPDELMFKTIFQILFAFTPVVIYLISRKYTTGFLSFLASFVFMSQAWFIQQMPALIRQEIALFFFSLIVFVLIDIQLTPFVRRFFLILFGLSLVVSHYSTTYIWLMLMVCTCLFFYILRVCSRSIREYPFTLSPIYVIAMLVCTFLWNAQLTQSSNTMQDFLVETNGHMLDAFSKDTIIKTTQQVLFSANQTNDTSIIQKEYKKISAADRYRNTASLYPEYTYKQYTPVYMNEIIPTHSSVPAAISSIVLLVSKVDKILVIDISTLIGIGVAILWYKKRRLVQLELLLFSLSTIPIICAIIVSPTFQSHYNLTRLFMQTLIPLSFFTITGLLFVVKKMKKYSYWVLVGLLILFFFYSSAFTQQLLGDETTIYFNRFGAKYDESFIYDSEIASATWLKKTRDMSVSVYADAFAKLRLESYAQIEPIENDVYPSTIRKDAYVYLTTNNYVRHIQYRFYGNDVLTFNFPNNFLDENKNLIYSNGQSVIYK